MKKSLWSALLLLGFSAAGMAQTPLPAAKASEYAGVYAVGSDARFTVVTDPDGRLLVRLTGQPFFALRTDGTDQFLIGTGRNTLRFGRSSAGRVDRIMLGDLSGRRTADPLPTILFLPPEKLREYVGRYPVSSGAEYDFTIRKGCLFFQLTGKRPLPLFADRPDHFVQDLVPVSVGFQRSPAGAVTALVIQQNGQDTRLPKAP